MKDYHAPLYPGNFYHVFNRGNNKENLFSNEGNYFFFLQKLQKYVLPYLKIFAYCLLPNHFHLLVQVREEENFTKPERFSKVASDVNAENEIIANARENSTKPERFSRVSADLDVNKFLEERFQRFFTSYALAYNKQQGRTGSLFEKRFKRIHIDSERYLIKVLHYIHNNPIHHHFCKNYNDWKYSSYNAIIGHQKTSVERDAVIGWFENVELFIEFHEQMIDYGEIEKFLFAE